jgi:hypothetical protein
MNDGIAVSAMVMGSKEKLPSEKPKEGAQADRQRREQHSRQSPCSPIAKKQPGEQQDRLNAPIHTAASR